MDPREQARQKLLEYVLSQGVLGYQFPSYDTNYLTDVGKLYENEVLGKGMYDSVTPRYRALGDDPRALMMGQYFSAVAQGVDPDQIIGQHNDVDYVLNPDAQLNETEKADLKKFASEQASRAETMWENEQSAKYYGIPDPNAGWDIPQELVAATRAQKTGLTNAQAINKELSAMQSKYNEMMAGKPKQTTTTTGTTDFGFSVDPAAWAYNKLVDAAGPLNRALGGLPGINPYATRGAADSSKISKTVEVPVSESPSAATATSPRVGALGKQMNQLEKLSAAESDYESRLTEALANRISEKFGSPYLSAAKEAQRIVASRKKGASGNWLQ